MGVCRVEYTEKERIGTLEDRAGGGPRGHYSITTLQRLQRGSVAHGILADCAKQKLSQCKIEQNPTLAESFSTTSNV